MRTLTLVAALAAFATPALAQGWNFPDWDAPAPAYQPPAYQPSVTTPTWHALQSPAWVDMSQPHQTICQQVGTRLYCR